MTKNLAIRLDEKLHAQLVIVAQLRNTNLTEEIRSAIEAHITACKNSGEMTMKADDVLADIERDAETRRNAIESLFGSSDAKKPTRPRTRKQANTVSSDD